MSLVRENHVRGRPRIRVLLSAPRGELSGSPTGCDDDSTYVVERDTPSAESGTKNLRVKSARSHGVDLRSLDRRGLDVLKLASKRGVWNATCGILSLDQRKTPAAGRGLKRPKMNASKNTFGVGTSR